MKLKSELCNSLEEREGVEGGRGVQEGGNINVPVTDTC